MLTHEIEGTNARERRSLLGALAQADALGQPIQLDFSALDRGDASKRRLLATWWVPALSNLLLGTYSDLDVRMRLPVEPGMLIQLVRNGLLFALAQRPGPSTIVDCPPHMKDLLAQSATSWNSREEQTLLPLGDGTKAAERLYLYSNTHEHAGAGFFKRYEHSAAFPWLGSAVPRPSTVFERPLWSVFIDTTARTLCEILDNNSVHAFNLREPSFHAGWLGPDISSKARSALLASITKGGKGSHNRLHFLSIDNGFGLSRTLRWQHPDELRHADGGDLVERIVTGRLAERRIYGHNGAGLWQLWHLIKACSGSVTVITEDDQLDRTAIRVEMSTRTAGRTPTVRVFRERLAIRGTMIHAQCEVPQARGLSPSDVDSRVVQFQEHTSLASDTELERDGR